jgi:DNA-binding FrmR family transcriptional regulator
MTRQYPEKGSDHRSHLNRLKRVEGQLKAIIKNVEDEKYCIGIINQVKSIRAALRSFEMEVVKGHLNGCVKKALVDPEKDVQEKINEIVNVFEKANKI